MVKKKTFDSPVLQFVLRSVILGAVLGGICFAVYDGVTRFFTRAPFFRVRSVTLDPALDFIAARDLEDFSGKNIFDINLEGWQDHLARKYPQVKDLKVSRRFPGQIVISAQKRTPEAQILTRRDILTIDHDGVVLSTQTKADLRWVQIEGLFLAGGQIRLGESIANPEVNYALRIIAAFGAEKKLSGRRIDRIVVKGGSDIELYLHDGIKVIMTGYQIKQKIEVLAVVLQQPNFDPVTTAYVDVRFGRPTRGVKTPENAGRRTGNGRRQTVGGKR
ncbi:MAG: cell division protein FtsQ/DivIB [Candidatus Omnitrophica bacterium]|nr:cell division protein FtsQ/DivIB [Candidatus Omnitrophota bacterium]